MTTVKVRNVEIGTGMPKICVPIVEKTREDILAAAGKIKAAAADLIEWRVDWFEEVEDVTATMHVAGELRAILGDCPLLFTFRTAREGGERVIHTEDYVKLNLAAARSGYVDLIDLELETKKKSLKALVSDVQKESVKVILSNHDFEKTPEKEEIRERLCKMQELGADILKIAITPQSKLDVLKLLAVTEEVSRVHVECPIITMSMGGAGVISRISGEIFGSAVTFGAVDKISAPGQLKVEYLKTILKILHENK